MSFLEELRRRNVIRVGIAYAIAAWVLLQITDVVGEILELPPWGGKLILVILAVGFPLALIFAWAFEMTPEGLKREKDVDRNRSITSQTGRKLDRVIIGVLAVAVAYLLVDKLVLQKEAGPASPPGQAQIGEKPPADEAPPASDEPPSVAVLPFVNMSGDPENEYFSDGLTETLLHMLAQLPDLRVAARTSSFAFKGQNRSVAEIAETLGVAHILEGSVQKSGGRVRVTAQLVRADDGFHVWSQNYTRPLEDIFAIQDEIATDVAEALDASLLAGTHMHSVETADLTAYDLYLKAMEQQAIYSYGSLEIAEAFFKQALAADPGFIDAKLGLVRNHLLMENTGLLTWEVARDAVQPLLEQVEAADPDNREARAFRLFLESREPGFYTDQERREATVENLRNLLPLMPTDTFFRKLVAMYLANFRKQYRDALEVVDAGLLVDPLSAELFSTKGRVLEEMDQLDAAERAYEKALQLEPDNPNHYGRLAFLAAQRDDIVGRLNWIRRAAEVDPQDHELASYLAIALYRLKLPEEGDRWARKVAALAPNSAVARKVEMERALGREDWDEALRLSRSMVEDRVGLRRGAFADAAWNFALLSWWRGDAQAAYHFIVAQEPSIQDFSTLVKGERERTLQQVAATLLQGFAPEKAARAWAQQRAALDEAGMPWDDEYGRMWDALMRDEEDEAARILLDEILSKPLADWISRTEPYYNMPYAELLDRPQVAARLAEREQELERARVTVREVMLTPEWSP